MVKNCKQWKEYVFLHKLTMSIFLISLKNAFIYRASIFFNILGSIFSMLISIALWRYIYSYDNEMMNYMILYVIVSNIIGMFYDRGMGGEIGRKVANGTLALELVRPVNFIYLGYMRMLGKIIANAIMRGIPIVLFFSPVIITNRDSINFELFGLFVVVVIMGHLLYSILYALIGFIAFVCVEIWAFDRLLGDTIRFLSGSFIPLALFPEWLRTFSDYFPFRYLYSFPIQILLGEVSSEIITNMVVMFLWIVGLVGLLLLLYRRAVNAFVVQGG